MVRRWLTLRRGLWLAAAFVGAGAAVLIATADRLPALSEARLQAARDTWGRARIPSYDMTLVIEGSDLEPGTYRVRVRDGVVGSVERNGRPVNGDLAPYGVDGLQRLLVQELLLAADPQRGFGAPPGYQAHLMAELGRTDGIPWRYRRIVGGADRWSEWRIQSFEPWPPPATPPPR